MLAKLVRIKISVKYLRMSIYNVGSEISICYFLNLWTDFTGFHGFLSYQTYCLEIHTHIYALGYTL